MKLVAETREQIGKNKVDKLRAEELIPGVIYSKGNAAKPVSVVQKDLKKVVELYGTSSIIDIDLDGKNIKGLFKEIQMHPFKNNILHFDIYEVDMSEKLRVNVPVVLENRDDIYVQPSVLLQLLDEIEVECLPADLPSEAKVDVQNMQIGDVLTVADLDIYGDEKIEILIDAEEAVASLSEPRQEEIEEAEDEEASAEVPTVSETEAKDEE